MAATDALELVHQGEATGGDGVELPRDAVAGAGEVDEKGDAVWAADEREVIGGAASGDEDGVSGGDEVLDENVVGETSL